MFSIVPSDISEAIYKKIDFALESVPELKPDRDKIFNDILKYFDENGVIPDFKLVNNKKGTTL